MSRQLSKSGRSEGALTTELIDAAGYVIAMEAMIG